MKASHYTVSPVVKTMMLKQKVRLEAIISGINILNVDILTIGIFQVAVLEPIVKTKNQQPLVMKRSLSLNQDLQMIQR